MLRSIYEQMIHEEDAEFRRMLYAALTPLDKQRVRGLLAAVSTKMTCVICGASDTLCAHVFDTRNTNGT